MVGNHHLSNQSMIVMIIRDALIQVSEQVQAHLQAYDVFDRISGDKFSIFLGNAKQDAAVVIWIRVTSESDEFWQFYQKAACP